MGLPWIQYGLVEKPDHELGSSAPAFQPQAGDVPQLLQEIRSKPGMPQHGEVFYFCPVEDVPTGGFWIALEDNTDLTSAKPPIRIKLVKPQVSDQDKPEAMPVALTDDSINKLSAKLGECIIEKLKDPAVLTDIYEQFELLVDPIKTSASAATSGQVSTIVERLKFNLDKFLLLPCCIPYTSSEEPEAFRWGRGEASQIQVKQCRDWLQKHVAVEEVRVIAVTSPDFSSYKWQQERVTITASKTDYLFVLESVASSLPLPPRQPSAAQLEDVLGAVLACYETKTSKKLKERGLPSMRPQCVVQLLVLARAMEEAEDSEEPREIPVFGGDLNQHIIVHRAGTDVDGKKVIHCARQAGRESDVAVGCMKTLLLEQLRIVKARGQNQAESQALPSPPEPPSKRHRGPDDRPDRGDRRDDNPDQGGSAQGGAPGPSHGGGSFPSAGSSFSKRLAADLIAVMAQANSGGPALFKFDSTIDLDDVPDAELHFEVIAI